MEHKKRSVDIVSVEMEFYSVTSPSYGQPFDFKGILKVTQVKKEEEPSH